MGNEAGTSWRERGGSQCSWKVVERGKVRADHRALGAKVRCMGLYSYSHRTLLKGSLLRTVALWHHLQGRLQGPAQIRGAQGRGLVDQGMGKCGLMWVML